ncbi:MAG: hypothetical protein HC779_04275 [Phyllobacteriaceae bacterium]|nr:hypothetical protein [Phyllobacteriaceae bacterium]
MTSYIVLIQPIRVLDSAQNHADVPSYKVQAIQMRNIRTARQQMETLDYMGDMLAQLAAMSSRDNHRLLSYILHTASIEIEDLKRLRCAAGPDRQQKGQTDSASTLSSPPE